jgi:hypothetical protein
MNEKAPPPRGQSRFEKMWHSSCRQRGSRLPGLSIGGRSHRVGDLRFFQMNQNELAHAVRIAFSGRGDLNDCVDHHVGDAVLSAALEPEPLAHFVEGRAHELEVFGLIALPVNGITKAP